ncbi:MAG: arginine N-succinyltransferase [Caulobacter sp.]|nr:arginine N-succinyltransferase [Vitreoscilla sp.]
MRDAAGQSPFRQGLSAHFYAEYPLQAQRPFGVRWRIDVAALLPRHPVYTSFLPPSAHAAIGQAAPEAQGWMAALVQAGLHHGHTWRCMTADRCWRRISTRPRRCWRRGGGSSCRRRRTRRAEPGGCCSTSGPTSGESCARARRARRCTSRAA